MSTAFPRFESPGQRAIAGVVIWLIGALIHPFAILAPIGIVLLLLAGVAYLLRPRNHTMYWRGRRIDLDNGGPGQRAYHVFFKH